MDSPASLAAAVLDRLEDDLPPVHWWLEQLACADDLAPDAAALVSTLRDRIGEVTTAAAALVAALP